MSFNPPEGILDIGNATLRVGKLEVSETLGLNQGLQNIVKNNLLITETTSYTTNQKWGLKLPTTWVAEFEVKGHTGKYIDFNFYNENSASNALGYNLTFKDTTMTLRYDGGSALGGGAVTIPTIVGAFRKVNIFFERGVIAVSIDGTRYLYFRETDGYNQGVGAASRVVSATGSAFVNLFIEANAADSAFKNLRIVNDRFISDKTSNIAFVGGNLGVGVHSPQEALDIRGNMHLTRVSNVSQIKVSSNVVAEYTGPHGRPLRKYPEILLGGTSNQVLGGYAVTSSSDEYAATGFFNSNVYNEIISNEGWHTDTSTNATIGGITGHWNKLELPKPVKVSYLEVAARLGYTTTQAPRDFTILGSNNNSDWVTLKVVTGVSFRDNVYYRVQVNSGEYYKYLVFSIQSNIVGNSPNTTNTVGEIKYYGHEEGDSSLDTTLKSVYNVPGTQQLEVYYDAKDLADGAVSTTSGAITGLGGTTINGTAFGDPQVSNGAFVFDGTGDHIRGTLSSSASGEWVHSTSIWFKTSTYTGQIIYIGTVEGTAARIAIIPSTTGEIIIGISGHNVKYADALPVDYGWHHITYTYAGGAAGLNATGWKLYVDGLTIPQTGGVGSATLNLPTGPNFFVGSGLNGGAPITGSIANLRIYNKVLNADQVKELYDYQKDYFLGTRSSVTLYKGHLGIGVAEPSGQLELAGDERIQEYPPRAFDGGVHAGEIGPNEVYIEGHGHFKAWTTGSYPDNRRYEAGGAFTKTSGQGTDNQDRWVSGQVFAAGPNASSGASTGLPTASAPTFAGYKGAHIILELPYAINLKSFNVTVSGETSAQMLDHASQLPSMFVIIASNDGNNWDTIFNHTATAGVASDYAGTNFIVNVPETYSQFGFVALKQGNTSGGDHVSVGEWRLFGTPGPTTLDKGSLSLTRSLDVPRISRYDVDTETPRPEKLVLDFDTTVNSSPTDISGQGNHGAFYNGASYSAPDKAFSFDGTNDSIRGIISNPAGDWVHSISFWFKLGIDQSTLSGRIDPFTIGNQGTGGVDRTADLPGADLTGHYSSCDINTTTIGWYFFGNDASFPISGIKANEWHHLTLAYEGGGAAAKRHAFFDGVEYLNTSTNSANLNMFANSILALGVDFGRVSSSPSYFTGQLSNFKIYNAYLEASEAKKLYNLGRTGRSMVISDTAVGIGKVPEAQLDVRGVAQFGSIYAPGTIIQVKNNGGTTGLSYSSAASAGTSGDISITYATGFKLSITPRSTKSQIYVNMNVLAYFAAMGTATNGVRAQVWRKIGTTYTRVFGRGGSAHDLHRYGTPVTDLHTYLNISFVDNAPNTLETVEYELRAAIYITATASGSGLFIGNGNHQPATITLMEIGGE